MAEKQVKFTVTADAKSLINALKEGEKGFDNLGKKSSQMGKILAGVGKAGFAAVGSGIAFSVKKAADFESAMSRVGALSGATGQEMEALTKTARQLGSETAFTATQAAEGMQFLAMAGFSAQDSMAALPGLLDTAAAGQLELGRAADITSNILSGFGLAATETGKVADVLTKTFTSSNTTLEQLGEGMKFVAPVASSLGISLEETAAAMGIMGNAGIQSTMAGTNLRQMLLSLSAPSAAAKELMEQYGIAVFDADGKMRPLPDILSSVQQGLSGMSEAQRVAALKTLVGQRAVSGFSVLLDSSTGAIQSFTNDLENAGGTAEQVASKQLDNLNGQLTILNSAVEDVAISVGESLVPTLTDLAVAGQEGIATWKSNLQIFSELAGAYTTLTNATGELTAMQKIQQSAAQGNKEALSAIETGLTSLAHFVIENTGGFDAYAKTLNDNATEQKALTQTSEGLGKAQQSLTPATLAVTMAMTEQKDAMADIASETENTGASQEALAASTARYAGLAEQNIDILNEMAGVHVKTAEETEAYAEAQKAAAEAEQARLETARGLANTLAGVFLGMREAQQAAVESSASFASQMASIEEDRAKKIDKNQEDLDNKLIDLEEQKQAELHRILTGAHARTTEENDKLLADATAHFDTLKQEEIGKAQETTAEIEAERAKKEAAAQAARDKELEEQKKHLEELKLNAALTALETTGQLEALTGGLATSAADAAQLIQAGVLPVSQDLGLALQSVFTGMETRSTEAAATAASNMDVLGQAMAGTLEGTVNPAVQSTTDALLAIGTGTESIGTDLGAGIESGLAPSIDELANTAVPMLGESFNTTNTNAQTGLENTLLATQNETLALQLMTAETLPALQEAWTLFSEQFLLDSEAQLLAIQNNDLALMNMANVTFPAVQSSAMAAINAVNDGFNVMLTTAKETAKVIREEFKSAADKINSDLIPAVDAAAQAFEKLAAAATDAANAAKDAGNASTDAGAGGGGGPMARGGPVSPGVVYTVGEKGTELFTPPGFGEIIPNDQLQIGGQSTVNDNRQFNLTINSQATAPENPELSMLTLMALSSNVG